MFLLVSVRHVGAHPDGHHYDVSIQISIIFVKTFLRISPIRNIPLAWILARVFAYLPPFYFPDSGLYLLKAFDLFWMGEDKRWTRGPWTPSLDRVHGPLSWTGSMDSLSWTRSMDSFLIFIRRFCTRSMDTQKQKIVPVTLSTNAHDWSQIFSCAYMTYTLLAHVQSQDC